MSTATEIDVHGALIQDILDITNRLGTHVSHLCNYHGRIEVKNSDGAVVQALYVAVLDQFRLTAYGLIPNKHKKPVRFKELHLMVTQDLVMIRRQLVELKNNCEKTFGCVV